LLTVSPKLPQEGIVIKKAHVLKVLYPHPNPAIVPMAYTMLDTKWRFIQPVDAEGDSIRSAQNAQAAAQFVLDNPEWRISLQMHKYLGVK
jgi:7-carboxy-7-deazaguanine synthase